MILNILIGISYVDKFYIIEIILFRLELFENLFGGYHNSFYEIKIKSKLNMIKEKKNYGESNFVISEIILN